MTDKLNYGRVNGDSELINCEKAIYGLDLELKQMAQRYFEEHIGSREEFREVFGKVFDEDEEKHWLDRQYGCYVGVTDYTPVIPIERKEEFGKMAELHGWKANWMR